MGWLDSRNGPGLGVNKRELAELLDVSEQTLTDWQDEGMPVVERGGPGIAGKYDTAEVVRWACIRELNKRGAQTSFDKLNEVRYRRELLNLRRDEGEMVLREDIRPAFRRYVEDALSLLIGIPEKYAQTLELTTGVEAKHQVLTEMVAEIRDQLGNYEFCGAVTTGGNTGLPKSAAH